MFIIVIGFKFIVVFIDLNLVVSRMMIENVVLILGFKCFFFVGFYYCMVVEFSYLNVIEELVC